MNSYVYVYILIHAYICVYICIEPLEAVERDLRKRQAARDKGDEEVNLKLQKSELQVRIIMMMITMIMILI
jgi:hypothetical protein